MNVRLVTVRKLKDSGKFPFYWDCQEYAFFPLNCKLPLGDDQINHCFTHEPIKHVVISHTQYQ